MSQMPLLWTARMRLRNIVASSGIRVTNQWRCNRFVYSMS